LSKELVAFLVAKMLKLPIYLRGSSYYLHTRVAGVQFKKSLQTSDKKTAIIRGTRLLELIILSSQKINPDSFDLSNVRNYEIDISRGIYRADGPEDHQMMMEALKNIQAVQNRHTGVEASAEPPPPKLKHKEGLTMPEVVEKLLLLKSSLKDSTVLAYRTNVREFSDFLRNPIISNIGKADVTRFQEHLAKQKNSTRTIDNKIGVLGTIFNFALKQGYMFDENPAKDRKLQTNRERRKSGWAMPEKNEIKQIFESEFLKTAKAKDKDYYWSVVLLLLTGCRISEITSLTKEQFQLSDGGKPIIKIVDSKTPAGIRPVPISNRLLEYGLAEFLSHKKGKIFRYKERLGKGSGNAVGKKFKRNLEQIGIARPKLVPHSLRKFCNNFLKENGVIYEARCQFIGHEIDDINNTVYSENFTIDRLEEFLSSSIFKLEMLAGIVKTKF
jgi:site-specific recombinase XerD